MAENDKKTVDVVEPVKKDKRTVDVVLKADYWDHSGDRIKAGELLNLPVDEAIRLIKEDKAERSLEDLK